ncbi:uncharacterized protein LOC130806973 [Amaranthus tricolor]|uniref:uncharacterized protein LOC130806973 n=1 Tax=Amaranthus tricolor TaxID=29722 RepID=UPI002588896B|nr:uncharacterized protein LOC130806973 [Amaranthus tricolor]
MRMDDSYPCNGLEQRNLPSSERTIFLTFSKGYPISYEELRDFLSGIFGDIIEELTMQEVSENEQPLYAKLVVRNAIAMEAVLSEEGKTKFSINGKHVWARKFINRQNNNDDNYPN